MSVCFSRFFYASIISIVSFTSLTYAQQNPTLSQPLAPPSGVGANHTFSQAYRIGGPTTPIAPMPLVEPSIFPLFIEDSEISSLVTLINGSAVSSSAVLTIRDLQGKASPPVSIPVGAHAKVQIKLADLLQKAGAQIRVGSILVTQGPELKSPAIVGQLTLSAITAAPVALTEEELVMPMLVDSQDLRSISESATDAQFVAVTSMSEEVQHITAQCYKKGSIATKTATLAPGGVTLLYPCSKDSPQFEGISLLGASETSDPAGISIHSDGPNGGFAAFGLARHVSPNTKGFLGSLQFIDPTSMHSSALVFTGVSADYSLTPGAYPYSTEVALANFSTEQSHVKIAFHKTDVNGSVSTTTKDIVLAPQSSMQVPLGQLGMKAGEVGSVIVSSDQLPGDLMAKILSGSDSAPNQLEQLAKDGLDERNGGAHPWTLQDSARSDLVLFNHSSHTEPFNIWITTEDGAQWNKSVRLAPFETRVVSINDLIRNKIADSHGRILRATASSGSVVWQTPVPGTGSGHVLIRNEANASGESFSCGIYSSICGSEFTPDTTLYTVGQTAHFGNLDAEVCLASSPNACSGTLVGTGNDFDYIWQSLTPNIATTSGYVSSNSIDLAAISAGTANIEGFVTDGSCAATNVLNVPVVNPTANVFVNVSGSKTAGDNLLFSVGANTCSESLGLTDCTNYWLWNVEGRAMVNDDASRWTVTQYVANHAKGITMDAQGNTAAFEVGSASSPYELDGTQPYTPNQATPDANDLFWIDSPGIVKEVNGAPVDTAIMVQNFMDNVCSVPSPSTCYTYYWYVKLTISGGEVIPTASSAGYGTQSLNF